MCKPISSRHLKLRIDPPYPGESLSSSVDRAASLWSISRTELLRQLGDSNSTADLDLRPLHARENLARAFGVEVSDIDSATAAPGRHGSLVAKALRSAYCPLCFSEDRTAGRVPYFRLCWAVLWVTHCPVHGTPLFEWVDVAYGGQRRLPHAFFLPADDLPVAPWISVHLREAEHWRQMECAEASSLWRALRAAEHGWLTMGMSDPNRPASGVLARREEILSRLLFCLLSVRQPAQRCLARRLAIPAGQYRVLGYDERRMRMPSRVQNVTQVRASIHALPARRALLILVAHSLSQLGHELRYDTGRSLPAGSSTEWEDEVASYRLERRYVTQAFEQARAW